MIFSAFESAIDYEQITYFDGNAVILFFNNLKVKIPFHPEKNTMKRVNQSNFPSLAYPLLNLSLEY